MAAGGFERDDQELVNVRFGSKAAITIDAAATLLTKCSHPAHDRSAERGYDHSRTETETSIVIRTDGLRTPGFKLFLAIVVALALVIPLFSVWLLVYDRQTQQKEATNSITAGWGGPQAMSGPVLVIPYRSTTTETSVGTNNASISRTREVWKELLLEPEAVDLASKVTPERRKRSIYEAVVYDATATGSARFAFPSDLARYGVEPGTLDLSRAELRFGPGECLVDFG